MTQSAVISRRGKDRKLLTLTPCVDCGRKRLVHIRMDGKPTNLRCKSCAVKLRHRTKDRTQQKRRYQMKDGYIRVLLDRDSPYLPMAGKNGVVFEHRLVMAHHLGRCLHMSEIVHHRNCVRTDNRLDNLELVNDLLNIAYGQQCRNCDLKKEIRMLRWQIKELSTALQVRLLDNK